MSLASGSIALRVRMDLLAKRIDVFSCSCTCLPDLAGSRSSLYVMHREHRGKGQRFKKVLAERWTERLKVCERQITQFASALQAKLHRPAHALMRQSRRYPAFHQVCRRGPGIHES